MSRLLDRTFPQTVFPGKSRAPKSIDPFTALTRRRSTEVCVSAGSDWTRSRGHSPQPDHEGGDCDEAQERRDGLIVARCDAAKVLDFVDEAFDEMTFLVALFVVGNGLLSRRQGGDHGGSAESEKGPEFVGVVSLVGDDVAWDKAVDQGFGLRAVVDLAGRRDQPQWIAERVDGDVDLGGQTAARTPNRLISNPPFPPAAC
jgi:hypothetical protein